MENTEQTNIKKCVKKWLDTDLELFLEMQKKQVVEIHKKIGDYEIYITAKKNKSGHQRRTINLI